MRNVELGNILLIKGGHTEDRTLLYTNIIYKHATVRSQLVSGITSTGGTTTPRPGTNISKPCICSAAGIEHALLAFQPVTCPPRHRGRLKRIPNYSINR